MSVVSVNRNVIERLTILSWDSKIKPGNLVVNHKLMLINHLIVTNHHTIILQQQSHQVLSPILVLSLQPQVISASSFVSQLPHSSSSMSYFEWVLDSSASHHVSRLFIFCLCVPFVFYSCHDCWWHFYALSRYWFCYHTSFISP
jgi:hypothetical protein